MDAIEKRARDLLAAEVDRDAAAMPGVEEVATSIREGGYGDVLFVPTALRAIIASLTPPEGYVLVDAKKLGAVRVARLAILQKQAEAEQRDEPHDASMWAECAADLDAIAPRDMQSARPEVKP